MLWYIIHSLKVSQVNYYLDEVAKANLDHKRDDIKKNLQFLLRNTSALEQVLITSVALEIIIFSVV